MKKLVVGIVVLAAILAAGLTAWTTVNAQAPTPPAPGQWQGFGRGPMHGIDEEGPLHDAMVQAMAEKLGLTVDELQAKLDGGTTMWQLAEEKGLSVEDFRAAMDAARTQAIDKAVADGTLTQEQADWMKARGQRGMGAGGCMGDNFQRGQPGRMGGGGRMGGPRWNNSPTN